MAESDATQSDVGIIGLDFIGRDAALLLAEQDFNVAAYDWEPHKKRALREQTAGPRVQLVGDISGLMAKLRRPRNILVFSNAKSPMSLVLDQMLPELEVGDLLMDAGDSCFQDTAKHHGHLAEGGIEFLGIGLAGGSIGARHGAIVMAGGGRYARERTRPLLEAMAATVRGEPSVSYFETPAAAHFVKSCHAGVEYALLQLLSETFDLLHRALLFSNKELHDAAGERHLGVLNGYLTEISGRVFEPAGKQIPRLLLEERLKFARNDPHGKWVVQSACELDVIIPTIEAAVATPPAPGTERRQTLLAAPFRQPVGRFGDDPRSVLDELHRALQAAMMITYAQGVALLMAASQQWSFRFKLHEITRAWRGCTHLRTPMLDDITTALQRTPNLPGLLSDDDLSEESSWPARRTCATLSGAPTSLMRASRLYRLRWITSMPTEKRGCQ
ncbi:MAG TPA: NAD(P)-binding domain-containing protein [Verrucomicrobiae bacterium]|jgi:6-phosphogluconate dehydrogenase|nr:NAD(P)-binding domain-containing protein [Verrucomicrobiae bacterium]